MENQIISSTFKFAGSHLINGVNIDLNSILLLLIFIALLLVAVSISGIVKYKRDKYNVPDSTTVENLKKEVKFYSSDFDAINQRLKIVEEKQVGINELYNSIMELKSIIKGGKKNE